MKACPFCAESIQDAAAVCRYCQRDVASGIIATAPHAPSPGVAAVLSVLIPGLGHVYRGSVGAGLMLFAMAACGYLVFVPVGVAVHLVAIVAASRPARQSSAASSAAVTPMTSAELAETARRHRVAVAAIGTAALLMLAFLGAVLLYPHVVGAVFDFLMGRR